MTTISKAGRRGIEVTVSLDGVVVYSRWFPVPSAVAAGDGPVFDVFFPWRRWDAIEKEQPEMAGYQRRPVRGVHAVGLVFLEPAHGGRVLLTLPAQARAHVNGAEVPPCDRVTRMELDFPFSGQIQGAPGWTLRFSGDYALGISWDARFRPGFFAQSLLFGFLAVSGILLAAFNAPAPPLWDEWDSPVQSRLAMLHWISPQTEKKPVPPTVEEEVIQSRLVQLRAARTVRIRQPRPRLDSASLRISSLTARSRIQLPHEEHVVDLTDPNAPPAEEAEVTLDLGNAGTTAMPAVVAPPPLAVPVQPPPMAVSRTPVQKPQQAKPPRRISFPRVDYPESARHLGIEGKVRLLLHIDEQGKVVKVEVIAGLHPLLDQAAAAAAKAAVYEPAADAQGRPVASTAAVTVRFELEEE